MESPNAGIELIMVLPGKVAKETRIKFANIICCYLEGDTSMITEIVANDAASFARVHIARMACEPFKSPQLLSWWPSKTPLNLSTKYVILQNNPAWARQKRKLFFLIKKKKEGAVVL